MLFSWPNVLVTVVGLIHVLIAIVEMTLWKKPKVHQRLGFNAVEAEKVAPIVANAGLYNGFLAVALLWSTSLANPPGATIQTFLLVCVIVAGCFGAVTLKPTTLVLQTVPGVIALIGMWMSTTQINK